VNVLLDRRQDGLGKMLGFSCLFHIFLCAFLMLNNIFFSPTTSSFGGFQVSLIAPGSGLSGFGGGDSGPGGGRLSSVLSSPKRGTKKAVKASVRKQRPVVRPSKKRSPAKKQQAAAPPLPKVTATRSKKPVPSKTQSGKRMSDLSQHVAKKAPAKVNVPVAPRSQGRGRLGKSDPPSQRDPERLEDWWRKQKKSLKRSATGPLVKTAKAPIRQTRTAKIDIKRPVILLPPVGAPAPEGSAPQKGRTRKLEAARNTPASQADAHRTASLSDPAGTAGTGEERSPSSASQEEELASALSASDAGSQSTGGASVESSVVGLDIKGIGTGTGRGGGAFFFPSYLQKIDSKIRWHWAPPPMRSGEDSLVVQFVIKKDGGIDKRSVEVKESSGNIFFDQAALRAVFAAHPLPPLPKAYTEDRLIIYMNFIVKEDT